MNYAVVYCSKTGNTKQLAQRIVELLDQDQCVYFGEVADAPHDCDVLFLGSWTDKGHFDDAMMEYMKQLCDQRLVLFGTAGFGGSKPYFDGILQRSSDVLDPSNQILGRFMCQGKMPLPVKQRYEKQLQQDPKDQHAQMMVENFEKASTHPDAKDMENFEQFIQDVRKRIG